MGSGDATDSSVVGLFYRFNLFGLKLYILTQIVGFKQDMRD